MTASTPDELIAGLLHSSLPKVTGDPTFEDLKVIRRLLNNNAMSVASYEGGGHHGHLGIIMTNEEYFAVGVDVFPVPNNPGPSATVVAGMTAAVIAETTRLHKEATQVYRTYHNVDQAIKKLIIEAFDDSYLNALSDEIVGYANCTSLQLLTHLLTYYAMIAPTELTQNYERLNAPYDPNQPTEMLFQKVQDARAFAVAGGQPYGAAMIVNVAYTSVFNTGLFPDACRAWKSRAIAGKTWAQFKIDFATAHRGYIANALHKFQQKQPERPQHAPYPAQTPQYGSKVQLTPKILNSPTLTPQGKKIIQQVVGALLYYGRAIDRKIMTAVSSFASQQAAATEDTEAKIIQLLNYCATHPDATICYRASDVILNIHSDAG
jgi:hypothetical protein